jgi:hypothetical protein
LTAAAPAAFAFSITAFAAATFAVVFAALLAGHNDSVDNEVQVINGEAASGAFFALKYADVANLVGAFASNRL